MDKSDIVKKEWKYAEGVHLGDFLSLNDNSIKGDTLLGVAIIYKTEKRFFADDKMYIKSLKNGETGIYVGKWDK